jgi:hypothetical protein
VFRSVQEGECREVLSLLKQHGGRTDDLDERALIAGARAQLCELLWRCEFVYWTRELASMRNSTADQSALRVDQVSARFICCCL